MPDVTSNHESYDFSQHVGPLFLSGDTPRAFLRLIGTVGGFDGQEINLRPVRTVASNQFDLSVSYALDAAAQPSIDEGADATFGEETTTASQNVVQIFQEGIQLSYSAMSNSASLAEFGATGEVALNAGSERQFIASIAWQVRRKREQVARDMNLTLLRGTYALGSAGVARTTRGLRTALSTNVFANAGTPRALTTTIFETALKDMIGNGAFSPGDRLVALCDADQFENLIDLYESSTTIPESRRVAGVMIREIMTKWGIVEVVYETDMDSGEIVLFQPQFCRPVFRQINIDGQDRGIIVLEKLATTGSASKWQLYLEAGMDYFDEEKHGVIDDLSA